MFLASEFSRFPYSDPLEYGRGHFEVEKVLHTVGNMLTEQRKQGVAKVVAGRTNNITLVLDQLYDRGNASAIMRSAEAMGYHIIHVIETRERFKQANRVTQGADKWLYVKKWQTPAECIKNLKAQGYQICVTSLEAKTTIQEVNFTQPTALVLGNEKDGVCPEILEQASKVVVFPMQGFVQSYNISVAGALCCYHMYQDRIKRQGFHGDLSDEEKKVLTAYYYLQSQSLGSKILKL